MAKFVVDNSVSNLSAGSAIVSGLGIYHPDCGSFVVEGNEFQGLRQNTLTCPYCGDKQVVEDPPHIIDCRPIGDDW